MQKDRVIRLKDGRKLGFREYGDPKGRPLFYFHGWPASRLSGVETHEAAKINNIRVISPDRPGFGISEFQQGRSLLDWARDIDYLADYLGLGKFSVLGISGGGPYAAVCAHSLPGRVNSAGIVVGLAPVYIRELTNGMPFYSRHGWNNYARFPILRYVSSGLLAFGYRYMPLYFLKTGMSSPADVDLIQNTLKSRFSQISNEPFRQGIRGAAHDLLLYTTKWPFQLEDIRVPVHLWYGARDKTVPLDMGYYYHAKIPGSTLHIDPEGGHLSRNNYEEKILNVLVP